MIICDVCGKECKGNSQFKNHIKTHKNLEQYDEIRKLYLTKDFSLRDLNEKGFSKTDIARALKGLTRTTSEALVIANKKYPTKSDAAKQRMSKSKQAYFKKHPDKLPYRLRHSSKESYSETRFKNALIKHNVSGWSQRYQTSIYEYDFAFPIQKVDVEIDGHTHTIDTVKAKDKRRDNWSKRNGWFVLRFTATNVKHDLDNCIKQLKQTLLQRDNELKRNTKLRQKLFLGNARVAQKVRALPS